MAESILSKTLTRQLENWMEKSSDHTFCERI
jgi:hypothetical protein